MPIRLFITGGTFDKDYDEIHGRLYFHDTHIHEMLRLGRCRLEVAVRTLMMVDSLEMTAADRQLILQNCRQASEERILISSTGPAPFRASRSRRSARTRLSPRSCSTRPRIAVCPRRTSACTWVASRRRWRTTRRARRRT